MTLYFGCRARNWDYLYKDELLKYHDDKIAENYYTAFSREKVEIFVSAIVSNHLLGCQSLCTGPRGYQ